jgi:hypothetical protein
VTNRDHRDVLRKAVKAGCSVNITGSNHLRIITPAGEVLFTGMTVSDRYAAQSLRRDLRKKGVVL